MNRHRRAASLLRRTALLVALLCALSACSPTSADKGPVSSPGSGASAGPPTYVALGDSFTAAPLVPVTDIAGGCFRSSANYPSLVAADLGARLDDRSCGGAQVVHLSTSQHPDVPAQLSAVTPDADIVTLGIGGNDHGLFARLTGRCPQLRVRDPEGAPCRAAMSSGGHDVLLAALERTRTGIVRALREVHTRAPRARVVVVGYPQIVSADHPCAKLPLAHGDYAYAEAINLALDAALRSAARTTGSSYVDVWRASQGHDVCSSDPWVNGSVSDRTRAAAYHPFAAEQAAVARLVLAAVRH